jgi:hypothetical protein
MNTEALEILNGEYAGLLFDSARAAARCLLIDHLTSNGEHDVEHALEIMHTEGREVVLNEITFYGYNAAQVEAVADVWDDVAEYLTEEVELHFDTSFDAENLPF